MELVVAEKTQERKTGDRLLSEGIAAWLLAAGILLIWNQILEIGCPVEMLLSVTFLPVLLCELIPWRYLASVMAMLLALVTAVLSAVGQLGLVNGMIALNNCAVTAVGENTGWVLPQYVLQSEETAGADAALVLGILAVFVSLTSYGLVRGKRYLVLLVCLAVMLFPVKLTGRSTGYAGMILVVAGMLGAVACHVYREYARMAVILFVTLLVLMTAGTAASLCLYPAAEYQKSAVTQFLQKKTKELVQKARYEKKKVNSLPKGNLEKIGNRETTTDTVLTITMSHPDSFYLKGFVGAEYTSQGWKSLPASDYYDSNDLFYWLHQDLFYGNGQLALADQILEGQETQENTLVVHNLLADSEYLYLPYEAQIQTLDEKKVSGRADETQRSGRLFGTREYTIQAENGLVKKFPDIAAQMFLKTQQEDTNYTREESYYNAFVYGHYTELSKMQETLLEKELGYAGDQKDGHIDYYSAIRKVETYLNSAITYDEKCGKVPEGRNFVNYFLTESRRGYDVHYATVATLMFRYYGIPARYVEGYLVTPDDVKDVKNGETISIPADNGHAWTEIYVDGLGWVPIEVTPKYRDIMEQPDLTRGLEAGTTQAVQKPELTHTSTPEEEKSLPQLLRETMFDLLKILMYVLVIFDIFVILFILAVAVRRIAANGRRKREFSGSDHRRAVKRMMGYATDLLLYQYPDLAGKSEKDMHRELKKLGLEKEYCLARNIGQKAAFSKHEISQEERASVAQYLKQLKKILLKQAGWYGRWVLRYIERLC